MGETTLKTNHARDAGFSMLEALIATSLTVVVAGLALVYFTQARKSSKSESAGLAMQRSGRVVVDELARAVQQVGYGVDRQVADNAARWQRSIVHAGAYALAFNVELDPALGPIDSSQTLTFPTGETYTGEGPATTTSGAETYVFSLDANGDGSLTLADRVDAESGSFNPAAATANPLDFALIRRIHGYDGSNYVTEVAPISGNLLNNAVAGVTYADGTIPEPLFAYLLTEDLNGDNLLNDSECVNNVIDTCPPAVPRSPVLYLWGDTDFDGQLSDTEGGDLRTRSVGATGWTRNPLLNGGSYASTNLAASFDPATGGQALQVSDATDLVVGSHLTLGSGGTQERLVISSINIQAGSDVIGLTSAPQFSHSSGEVVQATPETLLRAIRAVRISVTVMSETLDSGPGGAPVGGAGRRTVHGMDYRTLVLQRTVYLRNQVTVPLMVELLFPLTEEAAVAKS